MGIRNLCGPREPCASPARAGNRPGMMPAAGGSGLWPGLQITEPGGHLGHPGRLQKGNSWGQERQGVLREEPLERRVGQLEAGWQAGPPGCQSLEVLPESRARVSPHDTLPPRNQMPHQGWSPALPHMSTLLSWRSGRQPSSSTGMLGERRHGDRDRSHSLPGEKEAACSEVSIPQATSTPLPAPAGHQGFPRPSSPCHPNLSVQLSTRILPQPLPVPFPTSSGIRPTQPLCCHTHTQPLGSSGRPLNGPAARSLSPVKEHVTLSRPPNAPSPPAHQ